MTTPALPIDPRVVPLLRDAAAWRLLGRLFECPDQRWRADIAALASEVEDHELSAAAAAAEDGASEGQYHSVFGPGGPAPPREASYHDSIELGSLMTELSTYYDVFGYAPSAGESPDHVAVEIGFLSYLKLKEAYALLEGDEERAALAAEAAAQFAANHLATMAAPIATVLDSSHLDYLARAARILAVRAGPRPKPATLPMLPPLAIDDDEGGEFECAGP
jgi:nitrate reductase assembly molybdenum cofactor insertion protein NarJ